MSAKCSKEGASRRKCHLSFDFSEPGISAQFLPLIIVIEREHRPRAKLKAFVEPVKSFVLLAERRMKSRDEKSIEVPMILVPPGSEKSQKDFVQPGHPEDL
jgi:hypothetical protein